MRLLKLICSIACIGFLNSISAQDQCVTPQNFEDPLNGKDPMDIISRARYYEDYTIKIYVHLVVEDNGTGGPTESELLSEVEDLVDYYDQHDICFALVGYDYIRDSDYASDSDFTGTDAGNLISDYPPQTDVLDIYILPDYTFYRGNAFAIPNHYLLIYAGRFNSCHLAHEVGHCMGLSHTHAGNATANNANCSTTGDRVCDTPADPDLSGNVNGSCVYTGTDTDSNGATYNPDVTNTMSYAPFSCRGSFTAGQEARMKATLMTNAILAPLQVSDGPLSLFGQTISSGERHVATKTTIRAGKLINFFTGYIVQNSAEVTHTAELSVTLVEGFEAKPSSGSYTAKARSLCNN